MPAQKVKRRNPMNRNSIPATRSGAPGDDTARKFEGRQAPPPSQPLTTTASVPKGVVHHTTAEAMPFEATPQPKPGDTKRLLIYATGGAIALLGPHKHDPETRYDGFQALLTTGAIFAIHAALGILGGKFLLLQDLIDLAAAGFSVYQLYRAYHGIPFDVPFISGIARKQAEPPSGNGTNQTLQ
jgi:hypothetical protein